MYQCQQEIGQMVDRAIASLLWWFESTLLHREAIIKKEEVKFSFFCIVPASQVKRKFGFLADQTLMPVWVAISVRVRDYA